MSGGVASDGDKADERAFDPFARYRFVGNATALVVVAACIAEFVANWRAPSGRDFLGFWSAARLAFSGHAASVYDNGVLHSMEAAAARFGSAGAQLPFPYPPAYLLLLLPFALLSFPLAMALWSGLSFAFYLFACRRLVPQSGWLAAAFPLVFANAAIGQNGFLTAGLFVAGFSLLAEAPLAAGAILGCLVMKPQLALMIPIALVAGGQWRAIGAAAASATAVLVGGLLLFGQATSSAWLAQAPLILEATRDGLMGWTKLPSIYAAARAVGLAQGPALLVHAGVAALAAWAVWRTWRSEVPQEAKIAVLGAASMLASPYVFIYDELLLVPALLWLARREQPWVVGLLWATSLAMVVEVSAFSAVPNLGPFLSATLLFLVCRRSGLNLTFRKRSKVRNPQLIAA